ncbi:MAG: hypothetical protein LBI43_07545 [Streptococcaceae bacterium]|nr:hypothetical protein [Streptococcaceae bacterium]
MKDYFSRYKFMGDYQMRQAFAMSFRAIPKGYQRVPIPLSPERFQARGFNQVTGFLEAATISYDDVLEKVEVIKQSSLSRQERLKSENPFRLKKGVVLSKRVCVIDDIYTTGATLQHAMTVLKNAGVTDVCSFSLCR